MGRGKDQIWKHAEKRNGRFQCKFCNKEFPGGATRIKSHLAGLKGHGIAICNFVSEEVQEKVRKEASLAIEGPNKRLKSALTSSDAKDSKTSSTSMSKTMKGKAVTQSNEEHNAEIVLSVVVVDELVDKLRSFATKHIISKWGFMEELIKLLLSLTKIQVVLHDAEKMQVSDESVMIWLSKLRDVAYDVDDMLDEFHSKILRKKVQPRNQMKKKVHTSSTLSNLIAFRLNMTNRIKSINQSLDRIKNDLRVGSMDLIPKNSLAIQMDSFLDDSEDVGRKYDVSKIVELSTRESNQQIFILSIVGMAGIGKTTLSKIVYNHAEIRKRFDVLAWVHVTNNFNVERILSEILKSSGGNLIWSEYGNTIVQELQVKLRGKRYLLVLDDVWNEDQAEWDVLRSQLSEITSNTGNNIIVTTRSDRVAKIVGEFNIHYLQKISTDECWSIFEKRAFANGRNLRTDLETIGREIAKRCGGLPWAARVLGGTMYFKDDKSEWLSIQNNKLWDLLDDDNNGVSPVLKLGFYYLPTPSLKKCFSYCAIFPKDSNMKKDKLIQHWMAEGFLEPFGGSCIVMEDIGNMYFNILLANSFFQDARRDTYGNIISCKMNDLVYDFALSISKFEIQILEGGSMNDINHVRRLVVRSNGKAVPEIPILEDGFTKLHTLVSEYADFGNMFSKFKCLRVLNLCGNIITELPDSIGQLIHLRFLYIANTNIMALPKSLTKLYNLQTLRIKNCHLLKELPKDLSNLINLRHIYIDPMFINRTPKDIGRLTSLQTLPFFTVNPDAGCSLEELGHLNQLSGELDIYNLEHVRDNVEAKSANLAKNAKIYKLGFHWRADEVDYDISDEELEDINDEEVLEGLQPHQNLKSLTIQGFEGKKFPSWMLTGRDARDGLSLFDNLIEITLRSCNTCEEVPTLGHLPCLKVLEINKMDYVRCMGTKFYSDGNYRNALFPTLRRLILSYMKNLVEWKDAKEFTTATCQVFPCLEELIIERCHELTSAPSHFPSLKKLEIWEMWSKAFENISSKLTTLTSLIISSVSQLACLPEQLLQNNTSLMSLEIRYCDELESISRHQDVWAFCTSLRSLHIWHCRKLSYIPDGLHKLISLHNFELRGCGNLRRFPSIHGVMPLLRRLEISDCPNLISIPDLKGFSSLTELKILNCPKLRTFPSIEGAASLRKLEMSWGSVEVLSIGLKSCTSLHYLKVYYFANLISIPDLKGFSSLTELQISNCPKLRTFPSIEGAASLRELAMSWCGVEVLLIGLESCTSLQILRIENCPNLKRISEGLPESLKTLKIGPFCEMLEAFPSLISSTSIQHSIQDLYLNGWAKLNSLPDQFQRFTALKVLRISNFDGMEALPEWLGNLSSLQKLSLLWCKKLMYLPTAQAMRRLTYLGICDCPILEARCAEGSDAAERCNIAHIPTIIIGWDAMIDVFRESAL